MMQYNIKRFSKKNIPQNIKKSYIYNRMNVLTSATVVLRITVTEFFTFITF